MNGIDVTAAAALWPLFSSRMAAEFLGRPEADVRDSLDDLVEEGRLRRFDWIEQAHRPPVYYGYRRPRMAR